MDIRKHFGSAFFLADRARFYISFVQFLMIIYLTFKAGLELWMILLMIPASLVCLVFDWFIIYPRVLDITMQRNPFMMEIDRKLDDIKERLK